MRDGLCYIQYNANTVYAFPNLSCTEGNLLPTYTSTIRETYYLYNGRFVLSNRQTVTNNYGNSYDTYISHISSGKVDYAFDANFLILPATLLILAFFSVIYKWFIRLRG